MNDKDKRLPKQFGDFAEALVMQILGQHKGMRVACVDHTGADLIAAYPHSRKRYAISVKARNFPQSESKGFHFDDRNVKLLRDFADCFDLVPAIAFVFCDELEGCRKSRVLICRLDTLEAMAEDESVPCVSRAKNGGWHLNYWGRNSSHLHHLLSRCDWDYSEVAFDVGKATLTI